MQTPLCNSVISSYLCTTESMKWSKIISRFKQFGGVRLLAAYAKMGVFPCVMSQAAKLIAGRTSRDEAYAEIRKDVNRKLQTKYADFIAKRKEAYSDGRGKMDDVIRKKDDGKKMVWTCWLQGFDKAPAMVKACQESMRRYITDREIIQLTYENYKDYVTLPEHIVRKYERGQIPPALFADLLRLEVLIQYGGTWMDATILCTDPELMAKDSWLKEIMDCNLFMFQALRKGDPRFYGTSNWFITARRGSLPLMVLRDVLTEYWRDYSVTLDYYMFHDFFFTIAQLYPEEISAMPRRNRLGPLKLKQWEGYEMTANGLRLKEEPWVQQLVERVCVHKLDYKNSIDKR